VSKRLYQEGLTLSAKGVVVAVLETIKRVRKTFGIPWWIWSIFLVVALITDADQKKESIGSRSTTLIVAIVVFVLLPWFLVRSFKKSKAKAQAKQAMAHEILRQEKEKMAANPGAKTKNRLLHVLSWLATILYIYNIFHLGKLWFSDLMKFVASPTVQASEIPSHAFKEAFHLLGSTSYGIWVIVLVVTGFILRYLRRRLLMNL
jgi:hypothetical protein